MIDRAVSTVIDAKRCSGCGLCIGVCPSRTLSMRGDKAVVTGDRSLGCGHCAAVCPADAITVGAIDPKASLFSTFAADPRWLPHGEFDTAQLVRLMASRRSCRNFSSQPVDRERLSDLVKIGVTAPSGTNSQTWTFTLLPTRESVIALGEHIALFFRRINRLSRNPWLRNGLRFIGRPELAHYYRDYLPSVEEALSASEKNGEDRLFHGAPAAIVAASRPGGSTAKEDALLATQNILLAAHSMGLGTCLIGFAVIPIAKEIRIKRSLGIPDNERVHAVIAVGYPAEGYRKVAGRKRYRERFVDPPPPNRTEP